MTIEVRTNYLKLFTGRPRRVEPNPQLPIILHRSLATEGEMDISQIRVMDDTRVLLGKARIPFSHRPVDDLAIYDMQIFSGEEINTNRLEAGRDFLGRKRIFSYKAEHLS